MNTTIFDKIWAMLHDSLAPPAATATNVVAINSNSSVGYADITATMLQGISPLIPAATATAMADAINAHSRNYNITSNMLPMLLSETMQESNYYTVLEENLFYTTAERIFAVWPYRFKTVNDAVPYLRNPQKLANFVYANRMGNTAPNDGYLYRGRGAIMTTGKSNYNDLQIAWNKTYDQLCSYLISDEGAIESAFYYWQKHNLGRFTTRDQVAACTQAINGGVTGLKDRQAIFDNISKDM